VGMLDEILNGIQDSGAAGDPGTQSAPGGSQGVSPISKALIGLFAAYAAENMGGMGGNMGVRQASLAVCLLEVRVAGLVICSGAFLVAARRRVAVDPRDAVGKRK
jgi:hypothetical protein